MTLGGARLYASAKDDIKAVRKLLEEARQTIETAIPFPSVRAMDGRVTLLCDRLNHDIGVAIYDTNFHLVYTNQRIVDMNRSAVAKIIGVSPDDVDENTMVGRPCYEWLGSDVPCRGCPVIRALKDPSAHWGRVEKPDGSFQEVFALSLVNRDGEPEIIGAVEFIRPSLVNVTPSKDTTT